MRDWSAPVPWRVANFRRPSISGELERWAARSPRHDPTLPLSAASPMLSFRTMFARLHAVGWTAIGFRLGTEGFVGTVDDDGIHVLRTDPADADTVFDSDPMTIALLVYGARPFADGEAAGTLQITGNRSLADRFVILFPLPLKVAVE